MPVPEITVTSPAPLVEKTITIGAAAAAAGIPRRAIVKLQGGGYLPAVLTFEDIRPLRLANTISAGGKLPVIQTGPVETAPDDEDRDFYGDGLGMSNEDWIKAQRGYWTGVGAQRVVDAGYVLIALGGVITGVTKVDDILRSGRQVEFDLSLIGRLSGELRTGNKHFAAGRADHERRFAETVLGQRYDVRPGGAVAWI